MIYTETSFPLPLPTSLSWEVDGCSGSQEFFRFCETRNLITVFEIFFLKQISHSPLRRIPTLILFSFLYLGVIAMISVMNLKCEHDESEHCFQ